MSDFVKFRITGCRFGIAGISEVSGQVGLWPFSRPVSYHVGVNCDAIEAGDDGVRIYRRGALRAFSRSLVTRPRRNRANPGSRISTSRSSRARRGMCRGHGCTHRPGRSTWALTSDTSPTPS